MGLDYADGCVNFRDVGIFLNWISEKNIFPTQKILRGGSTDFIKNIAEIGNPGTIINLRKGSDLHTFDLDYYHFPISNKYEKYYTEQSEVRTWLNQIVKLFEDPMLKYPVFIHCLSGKDRTGIVVAALLLTAGIDRQTILEEYLLSEGEVKAEWINAAIDGILQHKQYFNHIDLDLVKKNLLTSKSPS